MKGVLRAFFVKSGFTTRLLRRAKEACRLAVAPVGCVAAALLSMPGRALADPPKYYTYDNNAESWYCCCMLTYWPYWCEGRSALSTDILSVGHVALLAPGETYISSDISPSWQTCAELSIGGYITAHLWQGGLIGSFLEVSGATVLQESGNYSSPAHFYLSSGGTAGAASTYTATGGTFQAGDAAIGYTGQATLNIAGGAMDFAGTMSIQNYSVPWEMNSVNLSSGRLSVGQLEDRSNNWSQFHWTGGTLAFTGTSNIDVSPGQIFGNVLGLPANKSLSSTGTITVNNASSIEINGGTLAPNLLIVNAGGVVDHAFGNANTNGTNIGYGTDNAIYNFHDGGFNLTGDLFLGIQGHGSFNQYGGASVLNGPNPLVMGSASNAIGVYNLRGGTFTLISPHDPGTLWFTEQIGQSGTGTFNHYGGTHNTEVIFIGGNNSSYNLYDGVLNVNVPVTWHPAEIVGAGGLSGRFTQSGGENHFRDLSVGHNGTCVGTVELSGGLFDNSGYEKIGNVSTGSFTQTAGTHTVASFLTLGENAGSNGSYTLGGTGTLTVQNGGETVGWRGTGTFTQNGGTNNAPGWVWIGNNTSDAHGTYMMHGGTLNTGDIRTDSGNGTFTMDGGTVTFNDHWIRAGINPGSVANYSITAGTVSNTTGGRIYAGQAGTGTLHVGGSAIVICDANTPNTGVYFGSDPTGHGSVLVDGSALLSAWDIRNDGGMGDFLQNGGTVTANGELFLGTYAGSHGTYTLNSGTLNLRQMALIAPSGVATLAVNGGQMSVTQDIQVGLNAGSQGAANISGGSVTVNQNESIGLTGAGTLTQTGGTHSISGTLTIAANSGSQGSFALSAGSLTAGSVVNGPTGTFNVRGAAPATALATPAITNNGSMLLNDNAWTGPAGSTFTQSSTGILNIEIAADGHFGRFSISHATLAGTLNIVPVGGYTPPLGTSFDIITGPITGTFSQVTAPCGWGIQYGSNFVRVIYNNTALSFSTNPATQTACSGTQVSLSVVAIGSPPPALQWRKDSANIPGATAATYTIPSFSAANAGSYDCVATNPCGSATSAAATLTLRTTPTITTQPAPQTICSGQSFTFSVVATGIPAPTYQWRKGSLVLTGATSSTYTIPAANASYAGSYSCSVSNTGGGNTCGATVISNSATLTVNTAPTVTTNPVMQTACTGSSVSFTAAGTSSPAFQWRKNGANITGATAATLTINPVSTADAANYDCVLTNSCGSATTATAMLSVNISPAVTTNPQAQSVCAGSTVSFSAAGTGSPTFQWRKGAVNIAGATSPVFTINPVSASDAANYDCLLTNSCGSTATAAAALTVTSSAPTITTSPASQTVCAGSSVLFSAAGTGSPTFQWRKNAANIPTATGSTFTINPAGASDAGSYDCVLTNICGSATTNPANLTVNAAPVITTQPAAQTVCIGQQFCFSVAVTGSPAPTYQWRKGAVTLSGATSNTYCNTAANTSFTGNYTCIITNSCGNVTTSIAALTVNSPPSVTTNPISQAACLGASATFTAAGTNSPTFQWRKNGANIAGATLATLTMSPVAASDAASYDCVLSKAGCSATTSAATLTVNTAPAVSLSPSSQEVCAGASVSFSAVGSGSPTFQWRKSGASISGATGSTFTINPVAPSDAAAYDCVLTNSCGSTSTTAALLMVDTAPVITMQPTSAAVTPGSAASFHINASGGPIAYQWQRNAANLVDGVRISGATTSTLTISPTEDSDQGEYHCIVTACGSSVMSSPALLTLSGCEPAWVDGGPAESGIRWVHAQAFDAISGGTLVFGGRDSTGATLGDTWLGQNGSWLPVSSAGPAPRSDHAMASMGPLGVLLFGGKTTANNDTTCQADTWRWDGSVWQLLGVSGPAARAGHAMTYDSLRNRVVLFGGFGANSAYLRETWEWDGSAWSLRSTGGPSVRFAAALAFDPVRARTVLFGGFGATYNGDTWEWDGSTWLQRSSTGPAPRFYTAADFDPLLGRVVLFGGLAASGFKNDSWTWNGTSWDQLIVASPTPRFTHAMSFDETSNAMIATGGAGGGSVRFGDSWVFTGEPVIVSQPVLVAAGVNISISLAASGPGSLTYQWQRDGANVADSDRVSGANSAMLSISAVDSSDLGLYTCIVSNACTAVTSEGADVSFTCIGDYNHDGGIDGGDVSAFFDDWGAGNPAADVNGDGGIDGSDVSAFFLHWESGC